MKENVALITGGAGHIGFEIAKNLASKGVRIALVDKDKHSAELVISKLGNEVQFIEANLLEETAFLKIKEEVLEQFGKLDYVVNNAAFYDDVPGWGVGFLEEGYSAWLQVMQVNLLAPFFLTQNLYPLLEKSNVASVVNISSIYGVCAPDFSIYEGLNMTNPAAYAASKGGLVQLTKWLSTCLAPKVRVNTVTPGGIERGQNDIFVERYKDRTPLKRMGKEMDVANAVEFLLSERSMYITGQNLIVDGGWTTW